MPSFAAAALTDAYRTQVGFLRRSAEHTTRSVFAQVVTVSDLRTLKLFPDIAARQVKPIADQSAAVSAGYLRTFAAADGARITRHPRLVAIAPLDRAHRYIGGMMARAGDIPDDPALHADHANYTRDLAVLGAVAVVAAIGRGTLMDGMRQTSQIDTYTRVTGGSPCAACLALAGEVVSADIDLECHAGCECEAEPNVTGASTDVVRETGQERFDAMDTDQQDALFADRGGAMKADLIRSGKATLKDLVTVPPGGDPSLSLTERPLESLKRLATR